MKVIICSTHQNDWSINTASTWIAFVDWVFIPRKLGYETIQVVNFSVGNGDYISNKYIWKVFWWVLYVLETTVEKILVQFHALHWTGIFIYSFKLKYVINKLFRRVKEKFEEWREPLRDSGSWSDMRPRNFHLPHLTKGQYWAQVEELCRSMLVLKSQWL